VRTLGREFSDPIPREINRQCREAIGVIARLRGVESSEQPPSFREGLPRRRKGFVVQNDRDAWPHVNHACVAVYITRSVVVARGAPRLPAELSVDDSTILWRLDARPKRLELRRDQEQRAGVVVEPLKVTAPMKLASEQRSGEKEGT